jgi:hypothetical protein
MYGTKSTFREISYIRNARNEVAETKNNSAYNAADVNGPVTQGIH